MAQSVVGNVPEVCRGSNAHSSSDFESMISHNVSFSSVLKIEDQRRCDLGTLTNIHATALRHKIRNKPQIGTQMASESPLLPELPDAYVLCSYE